MSKTPLSVHADSPVSVSMSQTMAGRQSKTERTGPLRFADLLEIDPTVLPLEDLRTLHFFARPTIRPHLNHSELDPVTIKKLVASVARQANAAGLLKARISTSCVSEMIQAEVVSFSDFLEDALFYLQQQGSRPH